MLDPVFVRDHLDEVRAALVARGTRMDSRPSMPNGAR
jgi:hypothetical protein